jgi:endoglucanase
MFEDLKRLMDIPSPSGFEEQLSEFIIKEITPYADKVTRDVLGNIIARKTGKGPKILLAAHLDEIGIISTYIEEDGFIRFSTLGSPDLRTYAGYKVQFLNGVSGIIGYEGKCELKDFAFSKCFVDIGASSKIEALEKLPIGTAGVVKGDFEENNGRLTGRGLDNKIGCYILIETIKRMVGSPNDVYFVFTVQEELGLRGAKAAAFAVEADYALSVDVTAVGDISGENKMAVSLGKGLAVKIKDNGIISHKKMVELLSDTAQKSEIPYQLEVLEGGSTDVGAIHLTKGGAIAGGISIPVRYIHSPNEMVAKSDVEDTIKLFIILLEKGIYS